MLRDFNPRCGVLLCRSHKLITTSSIVVNNPLLITHSVLFNISIPLESVGHGSGRCVKYHYHHVSQNIISPYNLITGTNLVQCCHPNDIATLTFKQHVIVTRRL